MRYWREARRYNVNARCVLHCDRERSTHAGGRCGFYELGDERAPELAYLLGTQWWGRGLATEMTRAALHYAFDERGWPRIVALILPDNARSLAVARKLGFVFERDAEVRGRKVQLHALAREVRV